MNGWGTALFFPSFILAIVLIAVYLFVTYRIERLLERSHPAVWHELGRPHLLSNNSISTNRRFIRFMKGGDCVCAGDEKFRALARSWQYLRRLVVIVFLLMAFFVLVDVIF